MYLKFLLTDDTKEYLQTKGNLSVRVCRKKEKDCCHFWTITEWKDIESIKAVAGGDFEKAKYYPQDDGIFWSLRKR